MQGSSTEATQLTFGFWDLSTIELISPLNIFIAQNLTYKHENEDPSEEREHLKKVNQETAKIVADDSLQRR